MKGGLRMVSYTILYYTMVGKQTLVSGAIYEGGFENGIRNGEGELKYPNGVTYQGRYSIVEYSIV